MRPGWLSLDRRRCWSTHREKRWAGIVVSEARGMCRWDDGSVAPASRVLCRCIETIAGRAKKDEGASRAADGPQARIAGGCSRL